MILSRLAAVLILLALITPAQAAAQFPSTRGDQSGTATQSDPFDEIAQSLATDPVYVDDDAENAISDADEQALQQRIAQRNAGPMYIAVVSGSLRDRAGGDATTVASEIARRLNREGVYAVVAGNQFRAGNVGRGLDRGVAPELATTAIEQQRDAGVAATLTEFVDLVGEARQNGGASTVDHQAPGTGGGFSLALLGLLAAVGGFLFFRARRQRTRQREEEVAELKETARDDLVALGDDIRALDLDVQMPGVDEEAKTHYATALDRYEQAEARHDKVTDPAEFGQIAELLEEGRYAMTAAKAKLNNQPVPERRPPCFFDPRHGPSTRDVLWAPDGYEQRPVPVCEADALRIEEGSEPMTREITAGGRRMPLYDAPGFYAPYAGGFFGGVTGFLPGLLFGSMLGGALGGFGGLGAGTAFGNGGGFDSGPDFSDFGGGGDFGGGDFGGGDF